MSIISTQIPEEIADAIKAQAKAMEVTPAWLVRKIIKSYMDDSLFLDDSLLQKGNNMGKIGDIENTTKL